MVRWAYFFTKILLKEFAKNKLSNPKICFEGLESPKAHATQGSIGPDGIRTQMGLES